MSDNQKIDGSNLSDNELIRQSLGFGYKINKMNRIPIFDILKREFNIEEDTRDFIVSKIIHHKIAKYADHDENDLIMGMDGIKAIQTDNPIAYMEKLEAQKNKPIIKGKNVIVGDNNSGNNQGRDFAVFPQSQPETSPNQNATPIDMTEVKVSKAQFIFWLFTAFTAGIGVGYMVFNILNKPR